MQKAHKSDDGIEDDIALVVAYDVTINASQLTDSIRAALLGHQMDDGDGMLVTLMWRSGGLAWRTTVQTGSLSQISIKGSSL